MKELFAPFAILFLSPPPIKDKFAEEVFLNPAPIKLRIAVLLIILSSPPAIEDEGPTFK